MFMNTNNVYNGKRKGQKRMRQGYKVCICIIVFCAAVLLTAAVFLFRAGLFRGQETERRADSQIELTAIDTESVSLTENEMLQDSDYGWELALVNKWNPIPENYEVTLVEVPGGEMVDERIYDPLMEMLEAAKEGNWDQAPEVVSGYRTQEKQEELYNEKIAEYRQKGYSEEEAKQQTQQWVAVPGHSEHQLGIAVDINGATYDLYLWLQENSYKYGFIFRYPAGKTDITGTAEEVWHYRYVGIEAAAEIYEQGLCLEEYLDKLEK